MDPHSPATQPTGVYDPGDAPRSSAANRSERESPGTVIGPYRLLQQVGEGGMGAVYLAEQERPMRRRVALKLIKPGLDSAQVTARFEAERQALALLDHPSIARVFDAGTTAAGRPYFAMEYVQGVPITGYCDNNKLTTRERLDLFVSVCSAIQHAHQKGIIHRDIKPSNILVAVSDGRPVVKVIDFGVAKATDQRLTELTVFTQHGAIVGTFEYMSPEQAEASPLGVDTRSDIYSLGVLLYELLTGSTPLTRLRLSGVAFMEMVRLIREEEPEKPSTRLSQSGEAGAAIAAHRRTELSSLSKLLRGEVDWIVLKCLEKDRTRRYESAGGLARDVERYLHDEPVEACPPSAGYKLRKFARKNRRLLATAGAFAVLLVVGAAISLWQAVRATRAEIEARNDRDKAIAAEAQANADSERARRSEAQANAESDRAQRSEAEAKAVLNFFQNQVLAAARPEGYGGGLGRNATVRQAIDAAEPKIAAAFAEQPLVEASVREVLGLSYKFLGEMPLALTQFQRSLDLRQTRLPSDHIDMVHAQLLVASTRAELGQFDRAIALLEQLLAAQVAKYGPDVTQTISIRNNLALFLHRIGQSERAIAMFEQLIADHQANYGSSEPPYFYQMNLGLAYVGGGRAQRAVELLEQVWAGQKAKLGVDHPDTLTTQFHLTEAYNAVGQQDRSLSLLERTLAAQLIKLGPDNIETITSQYRLYTAYHDRGDDARAGPVLRDFLGAVSRTKAADVGSWLSSLNLADDWSRFDAQGLLGVSWVAEKKYAEAEALLLTAYEGLKKREARIPATSKKRLNEAVNRIVQLYEAWGKPDEAINWRNKLGRSTDS